MESNAERGIQISTQIREDFQIWITSSRDVFEPHCHFEFEISSIISIVAAIRYQLKSTSNRDATFFRSEPIQ